MKRLSEKEKQLWRMIGAGIMLVVVLMIMLGVGMFIAEKQNESIKAHPEINTTIVGLECPWHDICGYIPEAVVVILTFIAVILLLAFGPGMGVADTGDVK